MDIRNLLKKASKLDIPLPLKWFGAGVGLTLITGAMAFLTLQTGSDLSVVVVSFLSFISYKRQNKVCCHYPFKKFLKNCLSGIA